MKQYMDIDVDRLRKLFNDQTSHYIPHDAEVTVLIGVVMHEAEEPVAIRFEWEDGDEP